MRTAVRWIQRLAVVVVAVALALGLSEALLRVTGFRFRPYPERVEFGYPDPVVLEKYFREHDRYLWVQQDYKERIQQARRLRPELVMIGCSCTEWGRYDQALQRLTRESDDVDSLRITNLACTGWSSYQGLQQMKRDVVALAPDVVTIFFGWNDHWKGFGVEDRVAARRPPPLLRNQDLRVVQLATKVMFAWSAKTGEKAETGDEVRRVPLDDFRNNLREMVDVARAHGIVPVLLTAPTSHRVGEEPEYLRERWLRDLSELVPLHRSYVEAVREVAGEKDVILCDLADAFSQLPREELVTFLKEDGIHFTPEGGQRVGELLFDCLRRNGLLAAIRREEERAP